jgi:hypothetical protein
MQFPGSAPTGKLPESVNFPLVKCAEPDDFNIIVFGDTQPYNDTEIDYLKRSAVNPLIGISGMTFGVTLGDITGDRPDLFEPVSRVISQIGIPWYHVKGNHDRNYDTDDHRFSSEAYEAFYGPATYSFNCGRVHFIVLDNIIHSRSDAGRAQYTGGLTEVQLQFVENDLKQVPADRLIVLMMHIPLFDEGGETFRHADRNRLFAALSGFPHTLSVSGHTHYIKHYFFENNNEGWKQEQPHHHLNMGAICGDWWKGVVDQYNLPGAMMRDGSPQGYFVLRFTGNQYIYDYRTVHYDAPKQIAIYAQKDTLYANFFAGNKFSTLRCRFAGNDWQPMEPAFERDPLFASIRQRWDDTEKLPGKRPSNPAISEHLWKAAVKTPGQCVVEVMATDMYGRTFIEKAVID